MDRQLVEETLVAWVGLSSAIRGRRILGDMPYNEAVVMLLIDRYCHENRCLQMPLRVLLQQTRMLKSQLNRTVDSLLGQGLLTKTRGPRDARTVTVALTDSGRHVFQAVHARSMVVAEGLVSEIGEEDARAFIRVFQTVTKSHILDNTKEDNQ